VNDKKGWTAVPKPIGKRYIDGDKLVEVAETKGTDSSRLVGWLRRQPKTPELVNNQATAAILGVLPNHLGRYRDRLPEPVKVEGTDRPMYIKSEIQALAKELARERKAKAKEKAA
jgi:hypothetical protein